MINFIIGLMVGGVVGVSVLTNQPVIAKITHSIGGDVPTTFIVTCRADASGRVDCSSTDIEKDKEYERLNKLLANFRQRYPGGLRDCGF